ncbi:MAG TPA: arylsulfatase [Candidatus Hydrogenedentes bacterium]|nr:arylsulfatase [Candidatus Hydrogenedentota bacterium]HPG68246.1 arylsulfatase [Candidatus Hydrogenedentota bacterium]
MGRHTRREFLQTTTALGGALLLAEASRAKDGLRPPTEGPNIVLILTDDQGYGDLGRHGNPHLKTPNLDRLHDTSVRFERFYVCPVCSPTRAGLMTGRYNYRTGAIDTYLGRSMMYSDEVTLAEILVEHGYRAGIFGKWHLGDNYPMRPMDQGFQESLVHRGGGLCQPSDWPGNSYFDPILSRNGKDEKTSGYCTDVFTDAALRFIEENRNRPFFVYLATNAPHTPLEIGEEWAAPYRAAGLPDDLAKVYGMIANIDANIGRLLDRLQEWSLDENTLVFFITDNGPQGSRQGVRWNAGMRAAKGSVYEGGIRVPCFVRWTGQLEPGRVVDRIAANIDILPTVVDLVGLTSPPDLHLDGRSLAPLLRDPASEWPNRNLFFQWHRGDTPELFRDCAVRDQRYKLVNGTELYDIQNDPGEQHDMAAEDPDRVSAMRAAYERWFRDVGATRGYAPPRIHVGSPHENPATLTRQDWRGANGWGDKDLGYWEIWVSLEGPYDITARFTPRPRPGTLHVRVGTVHAEQPVEKNAGEGVFRGMRLSRGDGRLEAWIEDDEGSVGVHQIDVEHVG